jgi:hypothetical protein
MKGCVVRPCQSLGYLVTNKRTYTRNTLGVGFLLALYLGICAPANANTVSYTFTGGVDSNAGVEGNVITYTDISSGDSVSLSGWSDLGLTTIEQATLHEQSLGLGICSSAEGSFNQCLSQNNRHGLDNAGEHEWVLITFSEVVQLDSFIIAPDGKAGRDITYYTGSLVDSSELSGATYTGLITDRDSGGLGLTEYNLQNGKSTAPVTIDITAANGSTEVWGNTLLIGASFLNGGDNFLLQGVTATTVVPLPAAIWLLISGMLSLGWFHKRQAK